MGSVYKARREMMEAAGRTAHSFGVNPLLGNLYMHLYLSPEAQSLDEIVEDMGVSKASVSIACRQLAQWGAIKRVWKQGDRKDYYHAVSDLRGIIENGLLTEINRKLDSASLQIEECRRILKEEAPGDPETSEFIEERLNEADKYRTKVSSILNNPIVRKML